MDGEYTHSLDSKNRLTIPMKYREELCADVVLACGSAKNLLLLPYEVWKKRLERISEFPPARRNALRELANHYAARMSPDSQGRIVMPKLQIDFSGIQSDVVVLGQGDYCVIWASEKWGARLAALEAELLGDYASLEL